MFRAFKPLGKDFYNQKFPIMKKISSLVLFSLFLSSCAIINGQNSSQLDYLEKGAKFNIMEFFDGEVEGFAIVQDGSGKIIDTKSIKISGSWEENKGVIKNVYVLSNGSKDSRTWLVTAEDGSFTAIGHDIVAPAQGKQAGNAMQMTYSLSLPGVVKGQKSKVNFDDKIYLIDGESAIMISNSSSGFGNSQKTIVSLKKRPTKNGNSEKKSSVKSDE